MGSDWQERAFAEFCDITRGGSPRPINDFLSSDGIPWVKIADASRSGTRYIDETREFIRPAGEKKSRKVYPGDLILSNSATPGIPMFMGIEACIHDGWLLLREFRGVDKLFCFYLLENERPRLANLGNGSVFTNLKTSILKSYRVNLPSIREQRQIAAVLGSLDDKIEANRKLAQTLESIASVIFKSWFVDFDPVRAKMAGATSWPSMPQTIFDLLPTAFVDTAVGEVPDGWRVGTIGDVALEVRETRRGEDIADDEVYVGLEHFTRRSLVLWDTGRGKDVTSNKNIFEQRDILFGKLRPYFHKVAIASGSGICSTDVIVARAKESWMHAYVALSLFQDAVVAYATRASTGTRMPRTNWKTLASYVQVIPDRDTMCSFQTLVEPMLATMESLVNESQTLAQTRDTLLPKLISGELQVEAAEEQAEEALA